jgi:recombination protein RecR
MEYPSKTIETVVEAFGRLPGVGKKTAMRMAIHLLKCKEEDAVNLGRAIIRLRTETRSCPECGNYTDENLCNICAQERRDKTVVCVVEDVKDVMAIEKTGQYRGVYHLLGGLIRPLAGVGPSMLNVENLFRRLESETVQELILALSATMEGEATTFWLAKKLAGKNVKITSIARGIPVGGELEYADEASLARAFQRRVEIQETS